MIQTEPIQSKNGKTYWVDSSDTYYKVRLKAGQYQSKNWDFAQTILPKFRNCIDIGSNNACNAIHYAERFEWVECFEPTPLAQDLWQNTVKDNATANVTLHPYALAECEKDSEIVIHLHNSGHNHIENLDKPRWTGTHWTERNQEKKRTKETQPIKCKTLDSFDFEHVDFIKIDVEGYEWYVLQGGEQTIMRERPLLQLEIVANQTRKFGYWAEQMIDWLRERNYRVLSKTRGWLDGEFTSHRNEFRHNGQVGKRDMDYFFVPQEWDLKLDPKFELFHED